MTLISRPNMDQRAWVAVSAIGAALIGFFLALPVGSLEQSAVYDVVGTVAVAAVLIRLARYRPARWQPWALMAAGQVAFVLGDLLWTFFAAIGQDPFPSIADGAYLFGYPLMATGLLIAIRQRSSGGDQGGLLDAAILTTGAAVAWWAFVLGPVVTAGNPDPLSFAISLAYPVGDLLLIGMALGLVMGPGARSTSFYLLIGSLVVSLVGDLLFGVQSVNESYVDGSWLDASWLLAYAAFAAAFFHPSMGEVFEPGSVSITLLSRARLALLAVAMLVGPVILAVGRTNAEATVLVVAGAMAVLSVLVLTRLAGMVRHLDRDIERRKSLEAHLSDQAFQDPLTGLANRRRFVEAVGAALATGSETAALFLDIDDLKQVNDTKGHDAGDMLLVALGQRIAASIRQSDLVARLGGDEFAVLLPAIMGVDSAAAIAALIEERLAPPFEIAGAVLRPTMSIGIALRPAGEPMTVGDLLRRADIAMYEAKARGKHGAVIYSPDLEHASMTPPRSRTRAALVPAAPAHLEASSYPAADAIPGRRSQRPNTSAGLERSF